MRFKVELPVIFFKGGCCRHAIPMFSNPHPVCNYDNQQSHTILILTVNVEMNLIGMG